MAESNTSTNSGGIGLFGLLFIVLFVLKLNPGGHLDSPVEDLSWWWVTAPLWGGFVLLAVIGVIIGAVFVIAKRIDSIRAKKRRKAAQERFRKNITK